MKKLIFAILVVILGVVNVNGQNRNVVTISNDYETLIDNIGAAAFYLQNDTLIFETTGYVYIDYKDFDSAGNRIKLTYKINEWDENKTFEKRFENVWFVYVKDTDTYAIKDSLGKDIMMIMKSETFNSYIIVINNKMMLIN